jgi:hypothetical protein
MLAELLVGSTRAPLANVEARFAILLVEGKFVAGKVFWAVNAEATYQVLIEDLDGDGFVDLGFTCEAAVNWRPTERLKGDPRDWLGAYTIESDGLKPMLPEIDSIFLP